MILLSWQILFERRVCRVIRQKKRTKLKHENRRRRGGSAEYLFAPGGYREKSDGKRGERQRSVWKMIFVNMVWKSKGWGREGGEGEGE